MAVFRYRMQNILNIKNQLETQARMEYAEAQAKLNEELDKLKALEERKLGYEIHAKELLESILDFTEIAATKDAVVRMEEYIVNQKDVIEEAEYQVEIARGKLTAAIQERKIHERLRESALEEFLQEEKEKEKKEIDELTSFTYGQKAQEIDD